MVLGSTRNIKQEAVGVIGAGPSGLITAHVLVRDGFSNVQVISRDASAGGVWARERIYPGLVTNNVHGEFRFSPHPMPLPQDASKTGGRLSGYDMCVYMETFADRFLKGRIRFKTEVLNVRRREDGIWAVQVENRTSGVQEELLFSRIVLCTGGTSAPKMPVTLSPYSAEKARFRGPVIHSSESWPRLDEILSASKRQLYSGTNAGPDDSNTILVIGGGKSAQDIATYLTNKGCKVTIVYEKLDMFIARQKPVPLYVRKSRLLSAMSPHIDLRTSLERFLHTTWLGSQIVHFIWKKLGNDSFKAYSVPDSSPLRLVHPLFWNIRQSDEGLVRPNSFHSLVKEGKIAVVAPARAVEYGEDGQSVILSNGQAVKACALILATGFSSSWKGMFDKNTYDEIGLGQHAPRTKVTDTWDYTSLSSSPYRSAPRESNQLTTSMYRGIVPAKNILRRDFAANGATYAVNGPYIFEMTAHWISSYFLKDEMRLPPTVEDAFAVAERNAAWIRRRFPDMSKLSDSLGTNLPYFCWPQATDELLEDMYLPSWRSGGNWLTWPLKIIDVKELATLSEERRALREARALDVDSPEEY